MGIWAGNDYAQNEHQRQFHTESLSIELEMGHGAGSMASSSMNDLKEDEGKEQYDAIIGIVAACSLIGGIVLFAKS